MIIAIITIILVTMTTISLWPVSVLLHEIGHSLPLLLFSNNQVLICVCHKEKSKKFFEFNVLRLHFKISYDSLFVEGFAQLKGQDNLSKWKWNIICLWGPFFSIALFGLLFYSSIYWDVHGFLKLFTVGFLVHCIIELFLIFKYEVILQDQYFQFSDGAFLYHNLFKKYNQIEINKSLHSYYSQEFKAAAQSMKLIIEDGFDHFYFFHSYLISLCYSDSPSEAIQIYASSRYRYIISPKDKSQLGALLLIKGNEKGKELIIDAFQSDHQEDIILANKAFLSLIEGNYINAIEIFSYLKNSKLYTSYAYSNLLLAKYKNKDESIDLSQFNNCLLEFPLEAYAFRNKGIYLFENENYKEAVMCFRSALKLDKNCYQADAYLDNCLAKLNEVTK